MAHVEQPASRVSFASMAPVPCLVRLRSRPTVAVFVLIPTPATQTVVSAAWLAPVESSVFWEPAVVSRVQIATEFVPIRCPIETTAVPVARFASKAKYVPTGHASCLVLRVKRLVAVPVWTPTATPITAKLVGASAPAERSVRLVLANVPRASKIAAELASIPTATGPTVGNVARLALQASFVCKVPVHCLVLRAKRLVEAFASTHKLTTATAVPVAPHVRVAKRAKAVRASVSRDRPIVSVFAKTRTAIETTVAAVARCVSRVNCV